MRILIAAATDLEMQAFGADRGAVACVLRLITGIGPVETALSLTSMLHQYSGQISAVVNFGIAGAYPDSPAQLLDICIAEQEILGDLGICLPERIERFAERGLAVRDSFILDIDLREAGAQALRHIGITFLQGNFVTVSSSSGTTERAQQIGHQYQGLCENMEGAAVVRVCEAFNLPCVELRCISNRAGERDRKNWRLHEACFEAGQAAAAVTKFLLTG